MIDAHFHIWQLARADYGWLTPAAGSIYRDVGLDDWRRVSAPCGVTADILVQAAPTDSETRFLLRQAHAAPDVLGVVGWVELLAANAPARIRALALDPKLRGLRPMLQDIADPDWILQGALQSPLETMCDCGLALDALVRPVHLARILAVAQRHPELRIVIDHGAKPDIAHGPWQGWADGLEALAACPQVFCKLSGLWTESVRGNPMHPRESPKRVQSRRKTQPGLAPGKALQQRVGLFWGLTRRAGVSKDAGGCCAACQGTSLGCTSRLPQRPWPPRRGRIRLPLTL